MLMGMETQVAQGPCTSSFGNLCRAWFETSLLKNWQGHGALVPRTALGLNREIGPKKPSEFTIAEVADDPIQRGAAISYAAALHARGCRPANSCEGFDQVVRFTPSCGTRPPWTCRHSVR